MAWTSLFRFWPLFCVTLKLVLLWAHLFHHKIVNSHKFFMWLPKVDANPRFLCLCAYFLYEQGRWSVWPERAHHWSVYVSTFHNFEFFIVCMDWVNGCPLEGRVFPLSAPCLCTHLLFSLCQKHPHRKRREVSIGIHSLWASACPLKMK
jgi:hypothetical protein